jgi:hypothetical protein
MNAQDSVVYKLASRGLEAIPLVRLITAICLMVLVTFDNPAAR